MTLLYIRGRTPFPPGANATDVIINEVHFNRAELDHYNYTLYSNGTLSNGTECYLVFNQWRPHMSPANGTFVNGTSCYSPVNNIGHHGSTGLVFAILFVASIFFSGLNLRKHGTRHLPVDRRWNIVGRRWKWYWLMALAACGTISCFMSVDVDRDYLPHTPLVLQSVFYTVLTPLCMAAVWEGVRHWGSWQERQIFDRDPYAFQTRSTREYQEFLLPILFYLCALITVFLTVPHNWSAIEKQGDPTQQYHIARPAATDVRWHAAGFTALAGTLLTCYSLEHSIYRYKAPPTTPTPTSILTFYLRAAPSQYLVALALLGIKIGYAIAAAYIWDVSPLRYDVPSGLLYGLGYTPALLLIALFNVCGFCELNEDRALLANRDAFESALADDVGIPGKRPPWWRKDRLRAIAREIIPYSSHTSPRSDHDDMARFVELGIIKPHPQEEGGHLHEEGTQEVKDETKEGEIPGGVDCPPRVTVRSTSETSTTLASTSSSSGPDLTTHRMEYVVQPGNGDVVEEGRDGMWTGVERH
ncbi:hypothetical protein BDW42DRAFT_194426 [Aspergillus taichungensis]|uniref:Uncharacterized protein n=1 Tax=Aspergillus taichungensis TaxID=482145 RepID=A0A2J5HT07_9EURO|nr:hypothetical protein BDW42DRAFT_194426 [Aspergillus taichungensis]